MAASIVVRSLIKFKTNNKGKPTVRNLTFPFIVVNGVAIVKAAKAYKLFQPVESQEICIFGNWLETEIKGTILAGEVTKAAL